MKPFRNIKLSTTDIESFGIEHYFVIENLPTNDIVYDLKNTGAVFAQINSYFCSNNNSDDIFFMNKKYDDYCLYENLDPFSKNINDLLERIRFFYLKILQNKKEEYLKYINEFESFKFFEKVKLILNKEDEIYDNYKKFKYLYNLLENDETYIKNITLKDFGKKHCSFNGRSLNDDDFDNDSIFIFLKKPLKINQLLYRIEKTVNETYELKSYLVCKISSFFRDFNSNIDDFYGVSYEIKDVLSGNVYNVTLHSDTYFEHPFNNCYIDFKNNKVFNLYKNKAYMSV